MHIQVHGVDPLILSTPYPLGWSVDVADDRLTALGDMNVLNGHLLLATTSVSLQSLDLGCERASKLVALDRLA